MKQPIKIGSMFEPFGSYTLKMAKEDSLRAKAEYIHRFIIRLHEKNKRYFGEPIKCVLAAAAITVLSINGFA